MKRLFIPGIKLINRLKYPQRFAMISILVFSLIAVLMLVLIWEMTEEVKLMKEQKRGIVYINPVKNILHGIEEHRALLKVFLILDLKGNTEIKQELKKEIIELESSIINDLKALEKINRQDNDDFRLSENIEAVSRKWKTLIKNSGQLSDEEFFHMQNIISKELYNLIVKIGDKSYLTLSPKLHSFYLSHSIIRSMPLLTCKIGEISCIGSLALAKNQISEEQKIQLRVYINSLKFTLESINEISEKFLQDKKEFQSRFKTHMSGLNNNIQALLDETHKNFIKTPSAGSDLKTFLFRSSEAIHAISNLYQLEMDILKEQLDLEITQINKTVLMIIFLVLLFLTVMAYLLSCFTISVAEGFKYLKDKTLQLTEEDLDERAALYTEDELKELSDSITKMILNFKSLLKREKTIRNIILNSLESEDIKSTLSTIVMNTAKLFNADRCFFIEYDADNDVFLPVEKHNLYIASSDIRNLTGIEIPSDEIKSVTDFIFGQKNVLAVDDAKKLNFSKKLQDLMNGDKVKSFMVAPLFYAGTPVGLMLVESIRKSHKYTEEDIKLMESISYQYSIVIHQARLMDQVKKKSRELEVKLHNEQVLRKITAESSLLKAHEEVDNYILNELINIFKVKRVVHLHVKEHLLQWYGRKVMGKEIELLQGQCFVPIDSANEIIPSPDELLVIKDVEKEIKNEYLKKCLEIEQIFSLIAYPTSKKFAGREGSGIIEITIIADPSPRDWTDDEKNFFRIIMDTLSIVTLETIHRRELEEVRKAFISTLTHDLKSPIIAEQKALEFLISEKDKNVNVFEYLEDIYNTNEDLLKLINSLLSSYHYESGKWNLNKTPENMEELIKNVIKIITPLIKEHNSIISCDIQEDIAFVNIDAIEIKRVLMNLISNAIKHNEEGVDVSIKVIKKEGSIQVSVSDNGQGIPDKLQSKVFQQYHTQKGTVGSGLGLYISKQIIDAHKGKIWFESEEGKGTTFYFTLPL